MSLADEQHPQNILQQCHLCAAFKGGRVLQVLAPYDAEDARGLLKAAIRDPDPVVFLENEILYGESFPVTDAVMDKDFVQPIGKAKARSDTPSHCISSANLEPHSPCAHAQHLQFCIDAAPSHPFYSL